MARARKLDEGVVFGTAVEWFWNRRLEGRSIRGMIETAGLIRASLHDAFVDKRVLFRMALGHGIFTRIEMFFLKCIAAGRAGGTIIPCISARNVARLLLAVLAGARVLARVRPERARLEGIVAPAPAWLEDASRRPAMAQ